MKKMFCVYFTVLFFASCGNRSYDQYYKDFEDFQKIKSNPRLSGWFPSIVKSDAYELKSASYLDKCAFGKFKYSNQSNYDSVFLNNPKVELSVFVEKIKRYENLKPSWFLESKSFTEKDFEITNDGSFDIARKKSTKEIYSILSY